MQGSKDSRVQGVQGEKVLHLNRQLIAYLLSLSFPLLGNPSEKPSERFRPSRNDSNMELRRDRRESNFLILVRIL